VQRYVLLFLLSGCLLRFDANPDDVGDLSNGAITIVYRLFDDRSQDASLVVECSEDEQHWRP